MVDFSGTLVPVFAVLPGYWLSHVSNGKVICFGDNSIGTQRTGHVKAGVLHTIEIEVHANVLLHWDKRQNKKASDRSGARDEEIPRTVRER